jgi:hypothetical protein
VLWIAALTLLTPRDDQGTDFFPLFTGAHAVAMGADPFGPETSRYLKDHWTAASTHAVAAVVAYPMPALLLIVPFTVLPLGAAAALWHALIIALYGGAALLAARSSLELGAMLFFFPALQGIALNTSTIPLLAALLICRSQSATGSLVRGLLWTLLPLKPQTGLLFLLDELRRAAAHARWRTVCWFLGSSLALWGLSFLVQPGWLGAWWGNVEQYRRFAVTISFALPASLLVVSSVGLPADLAISALTLVLFPANDLYVFGILVLAWRHFPARVAALASLISLVPVSLQGEADDARSALYFVVVPLAAALLLRQLARFERYRGLRGHLGAAA